MLHKRLLPAALALLASLSLAGCVGGHTASSRFYLLEPTQDTVNLPTDTRKITVVLAPVRIPAYLDRAQIVTANGDNSYSLSEYERWAEGLDHNISRVLQQELAGLVPADVVATPVVGIPVLKLAVTILQFHADAQGQARLEAQWQISRDGQSVSVQQRSYREPAAPGDYRQIVSALNLCLKRMARDIASDLQAGKPES